MMTSTAASRDDRGPVRAMFRGALLPGLIGIVVLPAICWMYADERAALSALAGAISVLVVLMIGLLGITAVVFGETAMSMAGAGVVYLGQLILLIAAMLVLARTEWIDGRSFALAAIAQTLVMQGGQIIGYVRARHQLYVNAHITRAES